MSDPSSKDIPTSRKLSLPQWASLAEVIASLGVIVSLYFLIVSINIANDHAQADATRGFYDSVAEVELAVASDPAWVEIVIKAQQPDAQLTDIEQYRLDAYVIQMFDNWDSLQVRFDDRLMLERDVLGWDQFFIDWTRRNVSRKTWDRINWQYSGGIVPKVEEAIAELDQRG